MGQDTTQAIKQAKPEFSDAEIDRIAKQLSPTATPQEEVGGLTFDLNDDEIRQVGTLWCVLMDKWFQKGFDLMTNMAFKDEVRMRFMEIGLVVDIGWETKFLSPTETMMSPTISVTDRAGGLVFETDVDRKVFDATRAKVDEITPITGLAEKLLD